jgi:hypothetical protein
MGHINLLMNENKCKSNSMNRMKFSNSIIVVKMTKIVEIWSCNCNIPKSSHKRLQVACSHKWTSYILASAMTLKVSIG